MRLILIALLALLPLPALAHVGHLGELAGHDHWVAGAAIGAAVLTGLYGAWKGRKQADKAEDKAEPADGDKETA